MRLYLSQDLTRRRRGYHFFEWQPSRQMTSHDRLVLRRIYRDLRKSGVGPMRARWHCWDLVDIGTRATRRMEHGK